MSALTVVDGNQWYLNSPAYQRDKDRAEAQTAADKREAKITDAVLEAFDAAPPSAEELNLDLDGISPERATLVRYVAWREALRRTRDDLEEGLTALHRAVDAPRLTEAEIERVTAEDKSGLLAAVRSGGRGLDLSMIRSGEKRKLLAKLADDQHAAEVAASTIEVAELDLEIASRRLAAVERRHEHFIHAAVREVAAERLAGRLVEQLAAVRATYLDVCGARVAAGGSGISATIVLPRFGVPGAPAVIEITTGESERAAGPWLDLRRALAADPRIIPPAATVEG